ncbi:MAG: FAD-binding oxidoreductase [Micrococcales bacterium]|nr:FAD-binding oxidoreductase [Micrococcales bacterium]
MDTDQLVASLRQVINGRVDASPLTRGLYSSDASNYRVVPEVVVWPRDAEELAAVASISRSIGLPLTMRGAGTSCAGNAIGPGIVVDTTAHMNQVLEIDPDQRIARVQPGVVLDTLQAAVKPYGLRFGPDPSTHSRCTFGGMIGNNACGNHAVRYGRTSDNIESLNLIDGQGHQLTAADDLSIVAGLDQFAAQHLGLFRQEFGRFGRQVSGYGLEHLTPEKGTNLARALVGSEGTCGLVTEATVKLVSLAKAPVLVVLAFDSMPEAADAVPSVLQFAPLAVEGLDARLVEMVRRNRPGAAIPPLPLGRAWLMVELDGQDQVSALIQAAQAKSHRVLPPGPAAEAMWKIREDGAGLGGRTPGGTQAWPGFEDAAVPPANLGGYLRGFDQLLAEVGLEGLVYGHMGDGCVHVRLDFPLEQDGQVLRAFMEAAADLVVAHGGSLSGEHGDGRARSELLAKMFSPAAIAAMAQFKALFDPLGLMNPGVLIDPAPLDQDLRRPVARSQPARQGFAFNEDHGDITNAIHRCTGVGKCRADSGGFMCPSYLATRQEKDGTRGRARVLQEVANGSLLRAGFSSPDLAEALELCLACKACSSDCPAGVDMARLKSETLHRRYKGQPRPRSHYLLGWLPRWTRLASRAPYLANFALRLPGVKRLVLALGGLDRRRKLPRFAGEAFHHQASMHGWPGLPEGTGGQINLTLPTTNKEEINPANGPTNGDQAGPPVLLWADSFSSALEPGVDLAVAEVLQAAGHQVFVVPASVCCGLTWITTGQLGTAKKKLAKLLEVLGPFAVNGAVIVGVEPSCLAVLRGDLIDLLPGDPRAHAVAKATKTLAEVLSDDLAQGRWTPPSLKGQQLIVQPHCHHYSVMGYQADLALLEGLGAQVQVLAGCCGMAGNFGMEKGHYEISVEIAKRRMLPAIEQAGPGATLVADGYSCRTQARDLADAKPVHLAQLLVQANDQVP